jgi:hypothetical protein
MVQWAHDIFVVVATVICRPIVLIVSLSYAMATEFHEDCESIPRRYDDHYVIRKIGIIIAQKKEINAKVHIKMPSPSWPKKKFLVIVVGELISCGPCSREKR